MKNKLFIIIAFIILSAASAIAKISITTTGITQKLINNNSGFVIVLDGGLDVKSSNRISLRPIQFDYLRPRKTAISGLDRSYRFGAGIVFH